MCDTSSKPHRSHPGRSGRSAVENVDIARLGDELATAGSEVQRGTTEHVGGSDHRVGHDPTLRGPRSPGRRRTAPSAQFVDRCDDHQIADGRRRLLVERDRKCSSRASTSARSNSPRRACRSSDDSICERMDWRIASARPGRTPSAPSDQAATGPRPERDPTEAATIGHAATVRSARSTVCVAIRTDRSSDGWGGSSEIATQTGKNVVRGGGDFGRSTVLFRPGSGSVGDVSSQRVDIAVIGAGPAGAATAIQAARSGAKRRRVREGRPRTRQGVRRRSDPTGGRRSERTEDPPRRRPPHPRAADDRRQAGARARLADHRPVPEPRRRVATPTPRCGTDGRRRRSRRRDRVRDRGDPGHRRRRARVTGVEANGTPDRRRPHRDRRRRAGRGRPKARRRPGARRAVRSGDPHLRRHAAAHRRAPRGVPVVEGRARHRHPRLRLDVPGRRRHRQHRRRRAVDDEGLQEAQPEHVARGRTAIWCRTTGISARTSNGRGRGGCRCRRSAVTVRDGWRSATLPDWSTR